MLARNRLHIERATLVKEQSGHVRESGWTRIYHDVPCVVREMNYREEERYARDSVTATYVFIIDRPLSVTEKDRLIFKGSAFNIKGVGNPNRAGTGRTFYVEQVT